MEVGTKFVLAVLMGLACFNASAQVIYKCVGKDKHVSFQTDPCGGSQRQASATAYENRPTNPAIIRENQRIAEEMERRNAAMRGGYGSSYGGGRQPDSRDIARRRCEDAKRDREQQIKAVGMARTYDLLRRLDAMVSRACSGL